MNELETIFCKVFGCNRSSLYLDTKKPLGSKEERSLEKIFKGRLRGEPIQYLLGEAEFMGLPLRVKPGVLIPRPETEILVDEAIKRISLSTRMNCADKFISILDIGTGSGNIPIALAASKDIHAEKIYSVDISDACLSLAKSNARLNHVSDKITFLKSDVFGIFNKSDKRFDFIISNPPYVAVSEYLCLPDDVKQEPSSALLAGEDGLYFYREIEKGSRLYLKEGGQIFLEIGAMQKKGIEEIFSDKMLWMDLNFIKDLNGIDRIAIIKKVRSS